MHTSKHETPNTRDESMDFVLFLRSADEYLQKVDGRTGLIQHVSRKDSDQTLKVLQSSGDSPKA